MSVPRTGKASNALENYALSEEILISDVSQQNSEMVVLFMQSKCRDALRKEKPSICDIAGLESKTGTLFRPICPIANWNIQSGTLNVH